MANLCETPLRDLPPATPLTFGLWTSAGQAARTLLDAGAGEALVLDGGRPLGVVTTRGLARVLVQTPDTAAHLAVRDLMDPVAVSLDTDYLPAALRHLLAAPSRRLAVVDAKGRAVGILAPFHVTRLCGQIGEFPGRTVASAMARAVVTAAVGETLPSVLARMIRTGVGGVVVAEADRPRGAFTTRDAVALLAGGRDIANCRVEAVMRAPVVAISPQLPLTEAVSGMDGAGAGRLAVTDAAGYLLGLLTWTDVAQVVSELLSAAEGAAFRKRAEQYRDLYDNAAQGLFRLDTAGRPLAVNTTLARLFGCRDANDCLRQARTDEHLVRLDIPQRRELLVRALGQADPVFFETHFYHHDGSMARIKCYVRAQRDALGSPVCLEGACADFSALPPPENAAGENGYRSIVEHITELICRIDAAGRLLFVNTAFARYWGKTAEACVAENFRSPMPDEDADLVARRLAAISPVRPTTGFEHRVLRPDGRIRWQRWIYRAMFDEAGTLCEYQAVGRDVTARKLAEERLRAEHARARNMLEALPLAVFFKDVERRFTGCNQAFETQSGIARERLVGGTLDDFLGEADARPYHAIDRELLAKGGRQVYEAVLPTPAGARHMIVHKGLLHDAGGAVAGIIGAAIDITERKLADRAAVQVRDALEAEALRLRQRMAGAIEAREQAESRLRRERRFLDTVLSGIQDGICVLTPDLTVTSSNKAMRALYAERGEMVGRKCFDLFHGRGMPCNDCPSLRALATSKLAISLVPKIESGSASGWVELFCYPLFDDDGVVSGVVEIVRDITAGKRLEAELADALERAEGASQAKGAFLANMSHEIRTPLNAVLGYVQLMLADRLEPRQRERLTVVEESAGTLLSIINDILDYSKIEAGRMELKAEPFDLVRGLEGVLKEQEVLAKAKGLDLVLDIAENVPGAVRGDGLRLRQVLRNLVNNAVKYTDKGGVRLGVAIADAPCAASGGEGGRLWLRFTVADTGIGIPYEQQETIFDSFTQIDGGLTKRQAGTGLGLAICRRLAGLMGGTISLESTPGQGSAFRLECPFDAARVEPASVADTPAGPRSDDLPPLSILLVEDNRVNRVFASDLLENRGHTVAVAENGRAALDYLAAHQVDVVLMDIQMPVMDGLAATRAIRAGHPPIDPDLPVIGLSAYAMDQERERFLAAGLDDYIIKPIDVGAFFAVVRDVLTRRGRMPSGVGRIEDGDRQILDRQGLMRQYRTKTRLLSRVGRAFVSSVPEQLANMEAALRAGDMPVCERVAHTLKGNAAMFGAATMRALAAEAEIVAAAGDADKFVALAPALVAACQAVVAGMDDFLRGLAP
ncbi:multi-sensor hybrid histidine kinase [Solidesulfovibrio fructosivorans JJ]]|uniref:Sensory/regulatory protein RpfC n=1 Tax=Solidesulfovibrio fructosivorans JJ] TaxID=596151 RepID=E1JZZ7_SOLFR|nr:PAS domain-containing protein [Solidesulfovibrio fructosivorans]EFL50092.1 multi-sensor hybrid histidine kinase [Solidesulfovibrio fructosivorans JJ]]